MGAREEAVMVHYRSDLPKRLGAKKGKLTKRQKKNRRKKPKRKGKGKYR